MPLASTMVERLMPRFPLSTGLLPAFSPPHGAFAIHPSIDAHIGHLQADDPIVGFQSHPLQGVHHASLDPLVAPPTQRSGRAPLVGDPPIGATEYENLDELLEDYVIGNAGTMTAERMIHSSFGQQDAELFPDGFDDVRLECGHGGSPSNREASATPRMIEDPCPPYMRSCSLLVQALSLLCPHRWTVHPFAGKLLDGRQDVIEALSGVRMHVEYIRPLLSF